MKRMMIIGLLLAGPLVEVGNSCTVTVSAPITFWQWVKLQYAIHTCG